MTVSCIIPTHQRPLLLREALQSVAEQTRRPDEVLVVDDVDDELTATVVDAAHDTWNLPVSRVLNLGGSGASSSRNAGAKAATGDRLAFLDDDDYWRPRYLEAALDRLEGTGRPVVFTHLQVLHDGRPRFPFAVQPELRAADVLVRNPGVTGSNIVLEREAFERIGGFDDWLWVSNDKDFLFRLLDAGFPYAVVPELLAEKRIHGGSRLTTSGSGHADGLRRYYDKHEPRMTHEDRRFLRFQIERSLRRATRGPERIRHTVRLLPLLGGRELRELVETLRERAGHG